MADLPPEIEPPDYESEVHRVCYELYQVIGALAGEFGVFDHPEIQRAFDNASEAKLVHKDLLPWPKTPLRSSARQPKSPVTERDLDEHPYSSDEQRVADFLYERGAGGGADPIGFLLASYSYVVAERNEMRSRPARTPSHIEQTEAGVIDWKMEVERLNQIIAAYEKRHPELDDLLRGEPHPEIGWPTQEQIKNALDDTQDAEILKATEQSHNHIRDALLSATLSSRGNTIFLDCSSIEVMDTIYDWIEASADPVSSTNNPNSTTESGGG